MHQHLQQLLGMMAMKPLLGIMKTPDDIFKDAYAYIMVICGGIAAQMLYNFLSSVLRALGNSKVPLYFLILAALLNIVLDMVFIIAFHMGAAGAAWATVISQGISGILCLVYIVKAVPILPVYFGYRGHEVVQVLLPAFMLSGEVSLDSVENHAAVLFIRTNEKYQKL